MAATYRVNSAREVITSVEASYHFTVVAFGTTNLVVHIRQTIRNNGVLGNFLHLCILQSTLSIRHVQLPKPLY